MVKFSFFYDNLFSKTENINTTLHIATVIVNLFHLLILFQKSLRSSSIFILMIGICLSDILAFTVILSGFGGKFWNFEWLRGKYFDDAKCLPANYTLMNPYSILETTVTRSTRPISIWLAILMALIRTLSIIFPMSNRIQKLTTPRITVAMALGITVFWIVFYSWEMIFLKIWWFPDHIDLKNCRFPERAIKNKFYVLALHRDHDEAWTGPFIIQDYQVRLLPVFIYPLLTVSLLIELWRIRKRRNKKLEGNTTKLTLFMTLSFMLSEGVTGFWEYPEYFPLSKEAKEFFGIYQMTFSDYTDSTFALLTCLRPFNALSHFFVCILMSTQYRDTVAGLFCRYKVNENRKFWKPLFRSSNAKVLSIQSVSNASIVTKL
uniref:G_PROTEIN_RECEP_F1_2 domain-containing protein n=2 Tax=Caenorhabditis tropicalis TaxID=1561998 RepID=A0A1I7UE48_9PELO